jgi:hypothetical protein
MKMSHTESVGIIKGERFMRSEEKPESVGIVEPIFLH